MPLRLWGPGVNAISGVSGSALGVPLPWAACCAVRCQSTGRVPSVAQTSPEPVTTRSRTSPPDPVSNRPTCAFVARSYTRICPEIDPAA